MPLTHAHPAAVQLGMPTDAEFWWSWNKEMLKKCDELWVAELAGWEKSAGVLKELAFAFKHGIEAVSLPDAQDIVEQYGVGSYPI